MHPAVVIAPVYRWHDAILAPLAERLRRYVPVEYVDANVLRVRAGSDGPDLIVVCDAGAVHSLREVHPDSTYLHVGHGLISKNQTGYHYPAVDYVCVASEGMADRLTARGHGPRRSFLATGLIQTDGLFAPSPGVRPIRPAGCRQSVLYAPTWNPTLSSASMFGTDLLACLRSDPSRGVVIKPHPHLEAVRPDLIGMWRRMAASEDNVVLCDASVDLIDAVLGADLLVSDASSATFHFLALDRPIVLVDNPDRFDDPESFDPDGIEWQWRDIAACTESVSAVRGLVDRGLELPGEKRVERRRRRNELFGELTDGRACERVAEAAVRILAGAM